MKKPRIGKCAHLFAAAALALASVSAFAVEYHLTAQAFQKPMPDGTTVTVWGYALPGEAPSVAGPVLRVPAGEPLIIHLTNNLPQAINGGVVPTSLVVPGQRALMTPVKVTGSDGRARVRSFTHETLAGQTVTYRWDNPKPGSFLYQSGTHQQVQVQMGLYGAVIVEAGANEAYPGVTYDGELTLVYSEIDPQLHAAVAAGDYGHGASVTSTLAYAPKYFLINGEAYTPGATPVLPLADAGQRSLLRFLNAGLETHMPVLQGLHLTVLAEDGNLAPYAHEQYSVFLPAGKTVDAIAVASDPGDFPLYDRRLRLSNQGAAPGGMLRILQAGGTPGITVRSDAYTVAEDQVLNVAAPGVLANDVDPAGGTLTASVMTAPANGALTLNADGSFVYTPNPNFSGSDSFVYEASNGAASDSATVSITVTPVSDGLTANADAYSVDEDQVLTVPAPGVLGNDANPDGGALSAAVVTAPANGTLTLNADGSFTYTPSVNFNGADSFVYQAGNGVASSSATVAITVNPVLDPVAATADAYTLNEDEVLNVAAPGVLGNDSNPDGGTLSASVVTGPANGTLALNADGSFSYTPTLNFNGADSFSYQAGNGTSSAAATVSITVTPVNDAPIANPDSATTTRDRSVVINVLANDVDPEGGAVSLVGVGNPTSAGGRVGMLTGGNVGYLPPRGFTGVDTFYYVISDPQGVLNVGTVTVTVQ